MLAGSFLERNICSGFPDLYEHETMGWMIHLLCSTLCNNRMAVKGHTYSSHDLQGLLQLHLRPSQCCKVHVPFDILWSAAAVLQHLEVACRKCRTV